ncbi:hypothetical protein RchiOBHm_Chr4g0443911 [Rosa chinensis]|uniref:Uncharacterized protein n=1 Tax=Rosa chinensis TaxID=74649 RepID=A0A2P6R3Z4_ROSCH|nr:hypothetical protein RchiOBHm_Chr4g0443911 [Rosa chinensis]
MPWHFSVVRLMEHNLGFGVSDLFVSPWPEDSDLLLLQGVAKPCLKLFLNVVIKFVHTSSLVHVFYTIQSYNHQSFMTDTYSSALFLFQLPTLQISLSFSIDLTLAQKAFLLRMPWTLFGTHSCYLAFYTCFLVVQD